MLSTLIIASFLGISGNVSGTIKLAGGRPAGQAVVYLEGEIKSKPLARAVVDQRNRTFIPHVSVVTVGTEISFPNNDTVFHNVFAEFDAKKFDLGTYARGKTKLQTFQKPGLVALLCTVHSEMSAYVMVVDTPFYAMTTSKGAYQIQNVAPGSYTLKVWHESGEKHLRPVEIKAGSQTLDVVTARR